VICRSAVVELRRHALAYLDRQGQVARVLLDNYDSFDIEPNPMRYHERMLIRNDSDTFRALVSGYVCAAFGIRLGDVASFERDARVFFKLIEPVVSEGDYERLGILFSFEVEDVEDLSGWYREQLKVTDPTGWTLDQFSARYQRILDQQGDTVMMRRWGPNEEGAQPGNVRIDVDHFQTGVGRIDAWNFDLEPELERARESIGQVLNGSL
jgi:hypothetical protein